jgi:hypothetical protein
MCKRWVYAQYLKRTVVMLSFKENVSYTGNDLTEPV